MSGFTVIISQSPGKTVKVFMAQDNIVFISHTEISMNGFSAHIYAWSGVFRTICLKISSVILLNFNKETHEGKKKPFIYI